MDDFEDLRYLIEQLVNAALLVEGGLMPDELVDQQIEVERRLALALGVELDAST